MLSDGINVVDVKGDVWKSCGRVCGLRLEMESVSQIRWGGGRGFNNRIHKYQ